MAESKEELKSLLIKVKEESEKAGLKLNIQAAISDSASWPPSDPSWSLRSSKRGPRSSSGISQTNMSKSRELAEAQRHWQQGAQKIQGPDLDAQHRLWEQQENQAHAAQRLPEVPGPQRQGAWGAADVQQVIKQPKLLQLTLHLTVGLGHLPRRPTDLTAAVSGSVMGGAQCTEPAPREQAFGGCQHAVENHLSPKTLGMYV